MKIFLYSIIIFIALLPALNYFGHSLHIESNEYGECIGITETEQKSLVYELNKTNVLLSILFFESVLAPSMIIANDLYCPIGRK